MNRKHLEAYVNKVIEDSCKAEKRVNDVSWEYLIVDRDIMLFAIKTNFLRVRRRIIYRLFNNLEKNFGLKFNLVIPEAFRESRDISSVCICDLYGGRSDGPDGLDPNHSFMLATFFGKRYTIRTVYGIRHDEELGLIHLNKLKEHGFDYEVDGNWEKFEAAYKAAYGETPFDGFRKIRHYYESMKRPTSTSKNPTNTDNNTADMIDRHRRQYDKDYIEHGCGYWSVCDDRSCPCSPSAPVSQGFDEDTWQSLKRSFEMGQEE